MTEHDAEQHIRRYLQARRAQNLSACIDSLLPNDGDGGSHLRERHLRDVLRQLADRSAEVGRLTRERDEARSIARQLATALTTYGREIKGVADLDLLIVAWSNWPGEPLPDWLTADPQQQDDGDET